MTKTALILIDIQNDYFPGGAMPLVHPEEAAKQAALLLNRFRENALPVVHIQHESIAENSRFMLPGTKGQEIHESVLPAPNETVLIKNFPNSFWQTELEECLRKLSVDSVLLVGMMTHMCISATARGAMERCFYVKVVADAGTTRDLPFFDEIIPAETVHKSALAELTLFAQLTTTAEVMTAL